MFRRKQEMTTAPRRFFNPSLDRRHDGAHAHQRLASGEQRFLRQCPHGPTYEGTQFGYVEWLGQIVGDPLLHQVHGAGDVRNYGEDDQGKRGVKGPDAAG
jgi:hypothetical protein